MSEEQWGVPDPLEVEHYDGHPITEIWRDGDARLAACNDVPWVYFWYGGKRMGEGVVMTVEWAVQLRDALTRAVERIQTRTEPDHG